MLGPHMWLQLALPDKLIGQAAQRLFPAVTAHARSSYAPAACPSWLRVRIQAAQRHAATDCHCACLVLMCTSSLSFLAKVRGQAAQRRAATQERVSSLLPSIVIAHAWPSCAPAACPSWQRCADRPRSATPQHWSASTHDDAVVPWS
jgi:hypothetical protein